MSQLPTPPDIGPDGLPVGQRLNDEWEVTPRDVKERLASGDIVLIDCRRPEEHELCRIDGATLVPLDDLGARAEELREHEDRPVVFYCHTGRRSLRAAAFLRAQGFDDVRSMAGGIELWSLDIDPDVPRY